MEQPLIGGQYDLLHTTNTEYVGFVGSRPWNTDVNEGAMAVSTPGKLKNLRVELNDTPGGGSKTYKFTLRRAVGVGAWGNTALTCTVGASDTQANDMVNEVSVAAGDVIVLECDPTDTPTARYAKWTIMFEGDNANESLLLSSLFTSNSITKYARPMGAGQENTENDLRVVCPTSGTIKNLFVWLSADPGATGTDAYRVTLRLGGATVGESLIVTITADDRTGNDTAHNLVVAAGDILTLMCEPLNSPTISPTAAIGMTFVADTDGESLILGGSHRDLDDTVTEYQHLITAIDDFWLTTEAQRYHLAQVCTLKKLYMLLSGTPGAGKNYTFTVRRNDASPASGLVVIIADSATTGNDTGNTVTISNDDELDLQVVPSSTPTVVDAYWGLVSYVAPSVATIPGGSPLAQMIQAGLV